uniref:Uncharacterized protein n=1 Tax=Aegilops tauschii subsp. strangulata TaxID=200361 RepID=A0A453AQR9_AEGTS
FANDYILLLLFSIPRFLFMLPISPLAMVVNMI